jgi:hypothetical protein
MVRIGIEASERFGLAPLLLETTIGAMTTSDLSTVPAHLRGTAARKRQHRLRDDSVGATASASGSTRPAWDIRLTGIIV